MIIACDNCTEKPTPQQDEMMGIRCQQAEERVFAILAGAPGSFVRDDIELLLGELCRRQAELETQNQELRRAQAALLARMEWQNVAQEGASATTWDWDPSTDLQNVPPQGARLYGLEPSGLDHYDDWRQIVHPDDLERMEVERDEAVAQHRQFDLEFRVAFGEGEIRWICSRGRALYDETGKVVRVVGMDQDVTERKRVEEALQAEQANTKALIENIDGSIWSIDTNYCLIVGNSAFHREIRQTFGQDIAVGHSMLAWSEFGDVMGAWKTWYDRALAGEPFSVEAPCDLDSLLWLEYRFNPIHSATGAVTGVTVFSRDISERKRAEKVINEQLAEIATYYDTAPAGLVVLDTDLRYRRINKLLAAANNVPVADHIGRTVEEIAPQVAEQARRLADHILATGEAITGIEVVGESPVRPGYMQIWLQSWHPIKRDDQEIIGFNVIAQDITERKRTEEALRMATQRLDAHLDNSSVAVVEFDPASRIIRWSQGATRLLGWTQEEVCGKSLGEFKVIHEDDAEMVWQAIADLLSGQRTRDLTANRNYRKDGSVVDCEWRSSIIFDDEGRPSSVLVLALDVTERNRAERVINEQLAEINFYYDNAPVGLAVFDTDLRFRKINNLLAEINGLSVAEHIGKTAEEIQPQLAEQARRLAAHILATGEPITNIEFTGETRVRPGYKQTWLESWHPIKRDGQEIIGFNVIAQDITERKRAEEALRMATRRLDAHLDNSPLLVAEFDSATRIIRWSQGATRMLGWTQEELLGKSLGDFKLVHEDDAERGWQEIGALLSGQRTRSITALRDYHKDGSIIDGEWYGSVIFDDEGRPSSVLVLGLDVTERKRAEAVIKEQLAEITNYYDSAPVGLAVLDTDLRYRRINKLLAEANGIPVADHIGKTIEEVVPVLAEPMRRLAAQVLATGEAVTGVEMSGESIARPGYEQTWLTSWHPIQRDEQEIVGFHVIAQDITERKRTEEALQLALRRIDAHIDNSPMAVIEFDPMWRVIRWSEGATRMFGWTQEEMLGKYPHELNLIHADDAEKVQQAIVAMSSGTSPRNITTNRDYRKDGEVIECEWYSSIIYDDRGQVSSIQSLVLDVTERKRAEEALRMATRRLDAHLDNSPLAIVEVNPAFHITRWSEGAMRMFGWTQEEVLGKAVNELKWVHEDDAELVKHVEAALLSGQSERDMAVNRNYRKDGAAIECEWYNSVIFDDEGQLSSVLSLGLDVTERREAEERLRRSEHNLAEAQRIGHSGSWEYDIVTGTATWSENMFRIFDVDPMQESEAALKDDIELRVYPEDREYVRTVRSDALHGKRPYDLDYRIVRKDGSIRTLHAVAEVVRDERDQPVRMIGRIQDITERKQVEERLRRSEHRLMEAQRIGCSGSWEVDFVANTMTWSENLFHIYGLTPGEPSEMELENTFQSLIHPEDLEHVRTVYAEALQGKRPYDLEYRIVRKDGSIRIMHAGAQVERDAHGQAVRAIGNVQDITEHKQMTEALRRSEASMRALLDNTDDLVSSRDLEGRLVLFNNSAAQFIQKLLGIEAQPGLDTIALLPEAARTHWKAILANIYAGAPYRTDFTFDFPDGTHHYDMSLHPIWSEGQVIGLTDFTRDITDRKREEEERDRLRQQLAQAQKMETVGRLAGGIAHEFNNLLAVILMRAELSLPFVERTAPLYRSLTTIQTTAQRSAELVRQLLGFARKQLIAPKVLDLNAVIEAALPMVCRLVGEEIEVVWLPGASLQPVKMDQAQVEQVVVNLCMNARDAINGYGVITIETGNMTPDQPTGNNGPGFTPGDYVMLAVTDNGRGMDQETIDHIFEPFYTMNEFGAGSGLGLAMVDGVVQQNGGRIQVFSEPGRGATFKIFLPRYVEPTVASAPDQSQPLSLGHGETVLLVEDEPNVLQMAKDVLEFLGYSVIAAATPIEAIAQMEHRSGKIDLLMTDVVMPAINGAELAKRLAAIQPDIKSLFMSGYPVDAIVHRGVLEGDVHFLQKPYSLRALAGKLREVLGDAPKSK